MVCGSFKGGFFRRIGFIFTFDFCLARMKNSSTLLSPLLSLLRPPKPPPRLPPLDDLTDFAYPMYLKQESHKKLRVFSACLVCSVDG